MAPRRSAAMPGGRSSSNEEMRFGIEGLVNEVRPTLRTRCAVGAASSGSLRAVRSLAVLERRRGKKIDHRFRRSLAIKAHTAARLSSSA
jgi:hypothetical protein